MRKSTGRYRVKCMSQKIFTPQTVATRSIPKHRAWLFRPIKQTVLDVGRAFDRSGDVLEVTGLPARIFVFRHPDHAGMILKHPEVGNQKYVRILPRVKWVMGRGGYILPGGSEWRERRRLVQGAFRGPCLRGYVDRVPALVSEMLAQWNADIASGHAFDICRGLQHLITRANFEMFFSHRLEEPELTQIIEDTHFVQLNFVRVSPLSIPMPGNLRFRRSVARLRTKMASLVSARRAEPDRHQDLLSVLLQAERENGWTEPEIVGEIFSVYFGAAVVATTLAWTLFLLASHPETQQQVIDEVARELTGRSPTAGDLSNLSYTRAVMLETTRLYPPSWGYPRHCERGMTIDGYDVPPDSMVIPMVYFTHRHPDFWNAPETFRPERFVGDGAKQIHPFAHLPFGAGARFCLGAQLAPMMLTMTLASIFQKLRLDFQPRFNGDPIADFGFEIHPQNEIRVTASQLV